MFIFFLCVSKANLFLRCFSLFLSFFGLVSGGVVYDMGLLTGVFSVVWE